jgi:hypothetical protein
MGSVEFRLVSQNRIDIGDGCRQATSLCTLLGSTHQSCQGLSTDLVRPTMPAHHRIAQVLESLIELACLQRFSRLRKPDKAFKHAV